MGGTATVAIRSDILGTQPGVRRDAITDNVLHHIMESLVSYGEDIAVQPMLAESWTVSEDGTEWTFTLRDGVSFHNGEPMTAEDVVWSWNRWLDPATEFACLDWYDGSEGLRSKPSRRPTTGPSCSRPTSPIRCSCRRSRTFSASRYRTPRQCAGRRVGDANRDRPFHAR